MFVVDSKKWHAEFATGQERLLVEMWMESAGNDTTCLYWSPLCSTLQTIRNVLTTLTDVERHILKEYHIPHIAEEALARTNDCGWLEADYKADLFVLRELLQKLRGQNEEQGDESRETAGSEKRSQIELRATTASFLKAFIAKVERDAPIVRQVDLVGKRAADSTTQYEVMARAVAELVNDLVHAGHSREHLHGWMRATVLEKKDGTPYHTRFQAAKMLGAELPGGCDVLFLARVPKEVPDSDDITLRDALPDGFELTEGSSFRSAKNKRYVIVHVERAVDRRAARDAAHSQLVRYLHSTRLATISFNREVTSKAAAVKVVGTKETEELQGSTPAEPHRLHNDTTFYQMPKSGRNEGTFAELDRVLYWLEQSRKWDDVGRLIALWTALEFLFSKTEESALRAVQDALPAYVVPKYPRELLLDLWVGLQSAEVVNHTTSLDSRLEVVITEDEKGRKRRKSSLLKLLELCLQPDGTNPLKAVIKEYPILLRKYFRVRRLAPSLKLTNSSEPEIWRDLDRFERNLIFDLRYAYRARNTVVHDAAIQIVQIEPLIQRLNWMLFTALDSLLYLFVHNPTLSLADLHSNNKRNYCYWKKRLKDETVPVLLPEVVDMPQPGLTVK
jgi:hypothetical protein